MGGSQSKVAITPSQSTFIQDECIETNAKQELERILERYPALLLNINNTEIVLNTTELIRTGCVEDIMLYLAGKGFKLTLRI